MNNSKHCQENYKDQQLTNVEDGTDSSRGTLLSWSRQQKVAACASFTVLAFLLLATACSKQDSKPALISVSSPVPAAARPADITPSVAEPAIPAPFSTAKKIFRKRPANVTYKDIDSGVSFLYPRKFVVTSGSVKQPDSAPDHDVSMNFAQPGGVSIATVAAPENSYPGTDFSSAFFHVNVNRSLSEEQCSQFAFVDIHDSDGEAVDPEKVRVGLTDMEMTSNFSSNIMKQTETQYYHSYENGACYEYVLGLGTEGFATEGGIRHVSRDEVFANLEKILATVKVNPIDKEHVAETTVPDSVGHKE